MPRRITRNPPPEGIPHNSNNLFALAEKIPVEELQSPKKHCNEQQNNQELFIEISKNLDQLNNCDSIKNILDTTKIIRKKSTAKKL